MKNLLRTNDIKGYIFIRIILGYVFLVAGLQKFIFPEAMGPGRFMEMGFPFPAFTAYFVGFFETLGGLFILVGLASRLAAIPLFITMAVAIITTKFPQLSDGFWGFAHAARLDISMLLTSLFVIINGSDKNSLDSRFFDK
ncbi:MAG: DoxX family protein [Bacteroidetes bacterium]|nr:MAG: DoxX family protein [Bacteroidota bacterium]